MPLLARDFNLRPRDVYDLSIDEWEVFKASADALVKQSREAERDGGT